ncbi:hypothetical protein COW53_02785 [bacterium CG17_big_fil_post_rev_8_21_14_2_50_64_8]|nr:MAG: hypothetical protein COW53_02785 [bacterium CG17_big_fil_post_rev_8_21_14_2_50_64_8]PJA75907.1 MAG: hypothetical protein CO151_04380 [bacterium CG_4_9_14_3_um_filter_65_15]
MIPTLTRRKLPWLILILLGMAGPAPAQLADDPCQTGKDLYRKGEFAAARIALEQCLQDAGDQVEVLLPLTVMAMQEKRLDDAVALGDRAVKVAPDDPEARYWYGRSLLRRGRVEDARSQWEKGMQISTTHKGILEGLARLSLQEGKPAQAYNLLEQIRRQGVDEPWLHRLLGDLAAGKGLWDQALGHLQAAMAKEGETPEDLMTASQLSIMAGKTAQGVDFGRRAVAKEPGEATYGALGEAYFASENMDSALVYLRRAVKGTDPDPRFVFNLANTLEVSGLYTEAGQWFRRFLAQQPDDAVGHFNFGIHLGKLGQTAEGMQEVTKALELEPTMLNARIVLAQMKESNGDFAGAREQVLLLQGQDPDNIPDLTNWLLRLDAQEAAAASASAAGKVHLLHMVLGSRSDADRMVTLLAEGRDFGSLAARFSSGSAASRGGDIGWVTPQDMKSPLREAIVALGLNETSPPVVTGGLYHLFKRIP